MALGNIDSDIVNADWPKRTPDKLSDVGGVPPAKPPAKAAAGIVDLVAYSPDQERDDNGRFGSGGGGGSDTSSSTGGGSPAAVLDSLSAGGRPDVAAHEVGPIMDAAAARTDNPDLTELHVEGTPKFGLDGLGYARDEMPVLGSSHQAAFIAHVEGKGIDVTHERVDAQDLKPMQKEVSASASGRLYQAMRDGTLDEKPMVVSSDSYVVDGHHRWGAATALSFERSGLTVPVVRIDLPGRELRDEALAWNAQQGIAPKVIGARLAGVDLVAYSPDQERDYHGRFSGPGGGGGADEVTGDSSGLLAKDAPAVVSRAADLRANAEQHVDKITADMHELEAASGGKLVGLDFRLKSEDSLARKIATDPDYVEKGMTLDERTGAVKDSVRYTIQLDRDNYASGAAAARDVAIAQGYQVETSNAWTRAEGYAGYHMTLRQGDQPAVEMQFHTEASFQAKEFGDPSRGVPASHVIYEKLRVEANPQVRAELQAQVAQLWAPIRATAPAGVLMLP